MDWQKENVETTRPNDLLRFINSPLLEPGITLLLLKLWQRFQSTLAPESLRQEIFDYY